ncbi:hypothetical protein QW71_28090 [Paenibacillus sp. IHB B 3415]|nr:hypothetical protein QW71_28090 [Paenibacillus sp. IHB B 3415]
MSPDFYREKAVIQEIWGQQRPKVQMFTAVTNMLQVQILSAPYLTEDLTEDLTVCLTVYLYWLNLRFHHI